MSTRRFTCFMVIIMLFVPTFVLATNYKVMDIYEGKIDTSVIVFKSGDKITGQSGITVETFYLDADGNTIDEGTNTIKSVIVNDSKCKEWVISETNYSMIQIGRLVKAAFGFDMKPAYTAADSEGYYTISPDTYSSYTSNSDTSLGKKVKFSGTVTDSDGILLYVQIGDSATVALAVESAKAIPTIGDNVICKGEVSGYTQYKNTSVPTIVDSQIEKFEYMPLALGDSGVDVLEMKERMRDLGFFKKTADLSYEYNNTCVERVKLFQEKNGLPVTGAADAETLMILYSNSAKGN